MSVFAVVGSSQQQIDGSCPEGWIEVDGPRPDGEDTLSYVAQADGSWGIDTQAVRDKAIKVELEWREEEMNAIADQLLRIEDTDPTALPGTEAQWRHYRIQVRAWVDGVEGYPEPTYRPTRPE